MIRKYFAPVLLALVASSTVQAQVNALPPSRHILVYGEAQARAIPDRFKITIRLEAVDPAADVARTKVEGHLRAVLAALAKADVATNEIVATSVKIQPRKQYDSAIQKHVYEGVVVSRDIIARFESAGSLEKFLAELETSEQVQVASVESALAKEVELNSQLRVKSIEDAKRKAETIARSFGVRLAGLYSVSDVAPQFAYGIREGEWPATFEWDEPSAVSVLGDEGALRYVTASRTGIAQETLRTGYVTYTDKIYAVFLIVD